MRTTLHRTLYIGYLAVLLALTLPLIVLAPWGLLSFAIFDRGDATVEVAEALIGLAILAVALGCMLLWVSQHSAKEEEHLLRRTGKLLLISALLLTLFAMVAPFPPPEEQPLLLSIILVAPLITGVAALAVGVYSGIIILLLMPTASWLESKTQYLSSKAEKLLSQLARR